ncbi:hypothetical protein C6B38_00405 [Spiroplasma sp. ChiS]|uniref:hypothetical protein n=1 Tax=Spiroplasma sp. ChiS TaxID=2099885 RepID=UPI000CF9D753|nr:hypothetical protein [Spiroplasma sp. ChiS]PQP79709.1 hypothetical protein C6B38_00405 [Spiroplasma sp. ChiS]
MAEYCKKCQCLVNQINSDYCLFCDNDVLETQNNALKAENAADIVKKDYSKPKARFNENIIIDCIRCEQEFTILNSEWLTLNKFYKCQKCKK